MRKLIHMLLLVSMLFTAILLHGEVCAAGSDDWNASAVTINRKEYSVDRIKSVNMLGDTSKYYLGDRPFYTVEGRDIYYIDQNSVLKKIAIDTKSEEVVLDINQWMETMSEKIENDPYGAQNNIFLNGGEVKQLFNDTYRNRLILRIYLNQPKNYYYFTVDLKTWNINQINMATDNLDNYYKSLESLVISGPDYIYGHYGIYDEYGAWISGIQLNSSGFGIYSEGSLYYAYSWSVVDVIDQSGNRSQLRLDGYGKAFYENFIYSIQNNGSIKKYNLTGAERKGIDAEDIAICDGLGKIDGQPLFTDDGDMVIFAGTTFRLLSKNSKISVSVKNNTDSTVSADLYIVVRNKDKTIAKIFCESEDIGADSEYNKSVDYTTAGDETVNIYCWKQGTTEPLAVCI